MFPRPQWTARRSPGPGEAGARAGLLLILVAAASVGVFHALTTRAGFNYNGPDSLQYMLHARNIVEGRPYSDTGYVPNPDMFYIPEAYPPGWPLLMAPAIAAFGLELPILKGLAILVLVASIFLLGWLVRDALPRGYTIALVLLVGLSPVLWFLRHDLLSEFPATLFTLFALGAYERASFREKEGGGGVVWAAAAGLAVVSVVLTRPLSGVVLAAFVVHDLVRLRRISVSLIVVLAVFATGMAFRSLVLDAWLGAAAGGGVSAQADSAGPQAGSGYSALLRLAIAEGPRMLEFIPRRAVQYAALSSEYWENGYSTPLKHLTLAVSMVPFILGFAQRIRRGATTLEFYFALYAFALLPWSFGWSRYLIPLVPLSFFYIVLGVAVLHRTMGKRGRWLAIAAAVAVGSIYVGRYVKEDYGPIPSQFSSAATREFVQVLRRSDAVGDTCLTGHPAPLAFMAGGHYIPAQGGDRFDRLLDLMDEMGADCVVTGPPASREVTRLVEARRNRFEERFRNAEFGLYTLRPDSTESGSPP